MNKDIKHGDLLYKLLPTIYRSKDNNHQENTNGDGKSDGDLKKLSAAFGVILDKISATIEQRFEDCFPACDSENAAENIDGCQPWLLPYFAQLLDVNLVSPHATGQGKEVDNAVRWRQRGGTLVAAEEIAQTVGGMEVEVQEGWKRVALTPRIGDPLLPESVYGENIDGRQKGINMSNPNDAAKHPGLVSTTVDFRSYSHAVRSDKSNPAAHETDFDGQVEYWRQIHRSSVPYFDGSYQDVSRRTVDMRTLNCNQGHYHPRRVLLFCPVPSGFFNSKLQQVTWNSAKFKEKIKITEVDAEWRGNPCKLITYQGDINNPVRITATDIKLNKDNIYRFENLYIDSTVILSKGKLDISCCAIKSVETTVPSAGTIPVFEAKDTIFNKISIHRGTGRFEYCTILKDSQIRVIQASDTVFAGSMRRDQGDNNGRIQGCIRYCCVPESSIHRLPPQIFHCTTDEPLFFSSAFNENGFGVLHPAASPRIKFGSEDRGEMGSYHYQRYCLRYEAVLKKISENLPVGLEVTLIPDETLSCVPPQIEQ